MASESTSLLGPMPDTSGTLPPAFVIGIGGAGSSGKTVLALAIKEIFERAMAKNGIFNGQVAPTVTILFQENYILPKNECPIRTFKPCVSDENVVMGHIRADDRVETVDTDCLQAINWPLLHSDIRAFLKGEPGSSASTAAPSFETSCYLPILRQRIAESGWKQMVGNVLDCVSEQVMFNQDDDFKGWLFKQLAQGGDVLNVRILIVEGSLLYSRESQPAAPTGPMSGPTGRPNGPTAPPSPKTPPSQRQQQQQQQHQRLRPLIGSPRACHEAIAALLDIRLYLDAHPLTCFRRCFRRYPYVDERHGGWRTRGALSRTRGYFVDIAFANWLRYDTVPKATLVQLLPGPHVLDIAMDDILCRLKQKEQHMRNQSLTILVELKRQLEEDWEEMERLMEDLNMVL